MKEKILEVTESAMRIWSEIFLQSFYTGNVFIKSNSLHMQVIDSKDPSNNVDYILRDVVVFKVFFREEFQRVYEGEFYPLFDKKSFTEKEILNMCIWLDPILKELNPEEDKKIRELFENKFTKGGKNYDVSTAKLFRYQLRNSLIDLDPKQKSRIIKNVQPYKILSFTDLADLEYYTDIPKEKELDLYRDENGNLSDEDQQTLTELSIQKILRLEKSKHGVSKSKVKFYSQYIPKSFLIDMVQVDRIPVEYLIYAGINKQDIFNSKYETLISVLENRENYPRSLRITSQDILDEYGKSINGSEFYKIAMYGYVDSKQVIDVVNKNKVLRLSGEKENNLFEDEEVLAFYSSTKLAEMFCTGKIDSEFMKKYKELLNDDGLFERESESSIEQIKFKIMKDSRIQNNQKDNEVQKSVLEAYKIGLCTPRVLKQNISMQYIEEQYLEGNISDKNIINLYKQGIVGIEIINHFFSDKEIFDLYLNGELDRDAISIMENSETRDEEILGAVMDGNMPLSDVVYLYLNNTITIDELEDAISFSQGNFDFSTCIDENTDFSKIKEMFERKIIDYSCVMGLKDAKIITQEELEELKQTMDKERFFEDLKGKTFILVSDRESKKRIPSGKKYGDNGEKTSDDTSEKYKKEKDLISKILGLGKIEGNLEEYATIESYNRNGKPTSLNGYKVFGSEENGLVIFSRFQKENAVFIMPFYQAAYFLNAKGQELSKDVVIEDKMKDKAYLKTLNQVSVIPHTEYFARNLSLAACKLSPEFKERYDGDEKYKLEVQNLCQEMRKDYRVQRGLDEK